MTPDQIKDIIKANFKEIVTDARNNPDGWSFFYREVRKGPHSTRIARAVESRGGTSNRFKYSVTSRLTGKQVICEIKNRQQLCTLFEEEVGLWKKHFGS